MANNIRHDEMRVAVVDEVGNVFYKDWKATAKRADCIRWTLESQDLPYAITHEITSIVIISGEELN